MGRRLHIERVPAVGALVGACAHIAAGRNGIRHVGPPYVLWEERPSTADGCAAARRAPRSRRAAVYSHRPDTYAFTVRKAGLGGTGVHGAVEVFTYVNRVAYTALGLVVFLTWHRRRDRASLWAAAAFGSLALLEILSFIPNHPGNLAERATGRVAIVLFVVFPYLLYRFTNEFRATGRRLANLLFIVTAVLIVWTIGLPEIPQPGESRSPGFQAFVILFFVHWTVLSIVAATSL